MDYKELAEKLRNNNIENNCHDCFLGYCAFEAATAITDLLARAEAAEARCKELKARAEKAEEIASDLCDDFTDFVTGGVHNAAPYCANRRTECVNAYGWCNGDNSVCRGFLPKAAEIKKEE